ncbi:MAG: extracellular solute-binding protein [bacterium]|nr:extracellular solute-binding protein [bacterium]MDE0286989.1 extracellular solute-binding protein [bacterium]MDE0437356.1 extracellular solute-binding protein [bacterium]
MRDIADQKKKWAALTVVLVLITAACGDDDAPATTAATTAAPTTAAATTAAPTTAATTTAAPGLSGEITVAVHPDWDFIHDGADQYMAANPGTTIILESIVGGNDYFPTLPRILATDEAPDVTVLQVGFAGTWEDLVNTGVLADLSDVYAEDGLGDAFLGPIVATYTDTDGGHSAINVGLNWIPVVYYNKTMFDELGIDAPDAGRVASMEDWYAITDALRDAGKTPLALATSGFRATMWFTGQYMASNCGTDWALALEQGWLPGATPTARFTDACAVEAFEVINTEWNDRGVYGDSPSTVNRDIGQTLFFTEEAGMFMSGSWEVAAINAADLPFEGSWLLLPSLAAEPTQFQLATIDGLGVAANSDNPELAADFISYIAGAEFQTYMAQYSRFSGRKDVSPDPAIVPPLALSQLAALDEFAGRPAPNTLLHIRLRDRIAEGWVEMLVGTITAEALMADLERIADELRAG